MMRQVLLKFALLILLGSLGPLVVQASAHPAPLTAEPEAATESLAHARLQQLKASEAGLLARHAEARRLCHQQFAVNDCLQAERLRHQAELRPIQREQEGLAAQLRRDRAEAQRERVRERQQEFAASEGARRTEELRREVEAAPSTSLAPARKSSRAAASTASAAGSASSAPASVAPAASSSKAAAAAATTSVGRKAQARQAQAEQQARQRVLQREALQRKLQAHQAQVKQKQAARTKPAAAALPVPSAAEIAGSRGSAPAAAAVAASAAAEARRTPALH